MKNLFKQIEVIALVALIGFSMAACSGGNNSNGGGTPVVAKYDGKDVLSNSYSISIGSNVPRTSLAARYARAAVKNDSFSLDVKGRDGKSRSTQGKVIEVNTDGSLTLKTDDGVELTVVVDDDGLDSIASDGKEITLNDNTTLTPRTFDNIYLRANRWENDNKERGEQYGSGLSVLVKDFPTNVSRLEKGTSNRYTITISGTTDTALSHVAVEVQGLTKEDKWVWLGSNNDQISISKGTFNSTVNLNVGNDPGTSYDLLDYKEIILQVTEVIKYINDDHPDWGQNYGSLPADVPNGQIMATISNFKISLKDKIRDAFTGNTNDYNYGIKEDGFSIDYRQAVWSLTPENIASVKRPNAKFEFILMDNNIGEDAWSGPTLAFIWQDPVRGLWWQDQVTISGGDESDGWKYKFYEGTTWDASRNKVTVDLSKVIKDNKFAASTQLNFIVACWWNEGKDCRNIGDLTITGANIVDPSNPGTGEPAKNITVYMQKPSDWSGLYAYVWDEGGNEYNGSGSGKLLTNLNNGFYSLNVESAEYGYVNIRFNNGGSKSALDVLGVNTNTYFQGAGTFSGDSSRIILRESDTSSISAPVFKASQITDCTVTLTWDPVPGIDGYILYDEFVDLDDNGVEIPGSEYWHFQKAFVPSETSLFDNNYGEYLKPEAAYNWKLVAIKYKENVNLDGLASIDPDYLSEDDYAPYYYVINNFGKLEVKTKESSLPKPTGLRVVSTTSTSVELTWNAVPNADYYMVWWQDPDDLEWYYIEEAYNNRYMDDDEDFIQPGSSYKYYVVAHNKQTYSKDSDIITANTTRSIVANVNIVNTSRAVSVTPSAPAYVSAGPNPSAANQLNVTWAAVSGIKKYEVGLFTSTASSTPVSGSKKTISGTFYSSINYTYTSVPTSSGAYYLGVRTVDGSKYSSWRFSSAAVSAFPKISIQSATSKISGNYKTISIIMNASWKSGANYRYQVDVKDPQGFGGYTYTTTVNNTNTITISNVPKGPKYTVTVKPYTGGVYGNSLSKSNL